MRRSLGAIGVVGICTLVVVAALTGGAATSRAGARTVSPFTITAGPSPAFYGKHIVYTISFTNASDHVLTQVQFQGDANVGTFSSATSGLCQADLLDGSNVVCKYPKMSPGAVVTDDLFYDTPPASSGAAAMSFTGVVLVNERANPKDPGSTSGFHPTGQNMDPLTTNLQAVNGNEAGDVLRGSNNTVATTDVDANLANLNKQSENLTVGGFASFLIASIKERSTPAGVCGTTTGVTPFLDTAALSVTGTFNGLVTLKMKWLRSYVPSFVNANRFRFCHDGVVLQNGCPNPVTVTNLPPNGCVTIPVFTATTIEATAYDDSNGNWSGGFS
jgi:hypothetical protein